MDVVVVVGVTLFVFPENNIILFLLELSMLFDSFALSILNEFFNVDCLSLCEIVDL